MRSRIDRVSVRRKPFMARGSLRVRPHLPGVMPLFILLVAANLVFAAASSAAPTHPAVVAQAIAQDTAAGMDEGRGAPTPDLHQFVALFQDTPEAPGETQEPTPEPPGETAEPPPSETPEASPETPTPTPGEPSGPEPTATGTPGVEETVKPGATQTAEAAGTAAATATAIAAPTATPAVSIWTADWPLGTVRIGEEPSPPTQPIRVTVAEWLRLALALAIVALVAIFGGRVLYRLLGSIIARQHLKVDETLLVELGPLLSWWLAAVGFHIVVWWVDFQNERARELFVDLAFLGYLGVATLTMWRLVDRAVDLYANRKAAEGQAATAEKLRPAMRRWAQALILLFSAFVALGRLEVSFSVPTILVMLGGLTISLAARDTVTDIIAGFFILIDQPFRIGDRIEVQGVDTWAEVVNIGLRSSVLRTRHNVEIIVPNSTIGKNQVINYSYPDSRYRMETHVGIAFGTNVEYARQVMIDAVRQVPWVLPDEPVDALYVEIGDSAMIFRVRWWIDFHQAWERSYDLIHTALHKALAEAGIESPYPSQSLNLQVDDQTLAEVWQAWQEEGEALSTG
jgi:MscS family membrane protein